MFVLPSHCRTLITWGHFIGFFQTPYLQFMLGDGVSLKRLVSLQTCVTWTTRTRRAIPQSCWQPSPLWKQRRTCGLWKNSSAVGTWMPKPARWARTLALFPKFMFMLANSALTCTGFHTTLPTTEHLLTGPAPSLYGCQAVLDDRTHWRSTGLNLTLETSLSIASLRVACTETVGQPAYKWPGVPSIY